MTGIYLCDYIVIRRCRLKIEDLYRGDPTSIYWFNNGFHWRAITAFFLAAWPFWPGFVITLLGTNPDSNWVKLFNISFICGVSMGFLVYFVITLISPVPHAREGLNYLDDERFCKSVGGNVESYNKKRDEEEQPTTPTEEKNVEPISRVTTVPVLQ